MDDTEWEYYETSEFVKSAEDLDLGEEVRESLKRWAPSVKLSQTPKTKLFFRSPSNKFQIWTARIPDPESNRGARAGFRLVYFFIMKSEVIYLDRIERRQNLGSRNERPRDQQRFTEYLNELKKYLMRELEED